MNESLLFRSRSNLNNYTITTVNDGTGGTCSDIFFLEMIDSSTCVSQYCGFDARIILLSVTFWKQLIIQYRIIDLQRTARFNMHRFRISPFLNWSIGEDSSISLENRIFVTYASSAIIDIKHKKKRNGIEIAQVGNYELF